MIHIYTYWTHIYTRHIYLYTTHIYIIHLYTFIHAFMKVHFWTDTPFCLSLLHYTHMYTSHIYTHDLYTWDIHSHSYMYMHVWTSICGQTFPCVSLWSSLPLSLSFSVYPPPSPLDWLVVSTPYICDATCDLCYRAHNIFVDLRSKMWYVRHIASYIAHMCHIGTANPTWGVIFESSKLKARTSLLPRFSEKRRSSFELWNSIPKMSPQVGLAVPMWHICAM